MTLQVSSSKFGWSHLGWPGSSASEPPEILGSGGSATNASRRCPSTPATLSHKLEVPRLCRRLGLMAMAAALTAVLSPCPGTAAESSDGAPPLTLLAGRVVQPDGTLKDNVAVLIEDGKIKSVVPASEAQDEQARRFDPDTVLCPGLIDLFSSIGAVGQAVETVSFVDPDASAADAVDPRHADFGVALRSGITTAMVAPAAGNLVSGACVSFRTFVDHGKLDVLRDDGPLVFAVGEGVWREDRAPTSRAGTLRELRSVLDDARKGAAHPRINAVVAGQLDALIVCPTAHDLATARSGLGDLFGRFGVAHTDDALELVDDLKGSRQPVVVGPYTFDSSRRVLLGAAALARRGAEVAFRGGFPESPPEGLRITAALAVRHGMEPAAARRAITVAPAKVAGLADRLGAITPGRDADLVVFSRDPLRLDAVVREVYVKGVRVYAAANQDTSPPGPQP